MPADHLPLPVASSLAVGMLSNGPKPKLTPGMPTSIWYAANTLKSPKPVSWSSSGGAGTVLRVSNDARISHFVSPIENGMAKRSQNWLASSSMSVRSPM